jgi:c-di-GMP-binding flagellar brake protein YcgR
MLKLLERERRRHYRVELKHPEPVRMNLILSDGEPLEGEIINISQGGVRVSFPADKAPVLAQNEKTTLNIEKTSNHKTVVINAIMAGTIESGGKKLYRFQFTDADRLNGGLDSSIFKYFNRRQFLRVRPGGATCIEATVELGGALYQARVIDISRGGVRLSIESKVARGLNQLDHGIISFELPSCEVPLKVMGIIIYHRPEGGRIVCGIKFDWSETDGFRQQEAAIADYVQRRQREVLQARTRGLETRARVLGHRGEVL